MIEGLGAGADDYIAKSSDFEVLKARVRAQIRRKQFEDENRRIREELLRKELEAAEARAARELAETRAALVEELERKNRELEAFSYSVSHDLRAPLRSIDGFSRALARGRRPACRRRCRIGSGGSCAASARMGELIDDLLELSRVGQAELRRGPTDLAYLAGDVVAELRRRDPDRAVEIVVPDALPIQADRRLIKVVLENLLGNAGSSPAARRTRASRSASKRATDGPTYFVRDNGAGFDMTYAEKLFRPFQRLHSTSEFPGTGIGLATVQRIVDRHGGRVWAAGTVGAGARFSFTLPPPGPPAIAAVPVREEMPHR